MTSPANSRRRFLRNASVMTAAASVPFASFAKEAMASDASGSAATNQVQKIELGVKPVMNACGAVLIANPHQTYATFDAEQVDPADSSVQFGTALVQLQGYVTHRSANESRDMTSDSTVDTESLDICDSFEVLNSTWAEKFQVAGEQPRHLIFTFLGADSLLSGGVHFECLTGSASIQFLSRSPGEAIDYNRLESWLKTRDARVARNVAAWLARRNGG